MTRKRLLVAAVAVVGGIWLWNWTDPNDRAFRELDRVGLHHDFTVVDEHGGASRFLCIDACDGTLRIYQTTMGVRDAVARTEQRLEAAGYTVTTDPDDSGPRKVSLTATGKRDIGLMIKRQKGGTVVFALVEPSRGLFLPPDAVSNLPPATR